MSSGRYGKYGEMRRIRRLRQRGVDKLRPLHPARPPTPHRRLQGRRHREAAVRRARASDAEFIQRLSGAAFQEYGPYGEILREWFDSGPSLSLIAEIQGHPAGFAMTERIDAFPEPMRGAELLAIAVDPSLRRRGIGRILLRRVEALVHGRGAVRLWLHTAADNRAARSLFERSGFRIVRLERTFYPEGQDALLMVKTLQGPSA